MFDIARPSAAVPADIPNSVRLQLVSTCPEVPGGDGWLHEIKHDGHRLVAVVTPDSLKLVSRNGYDRTALFREPFRPLAGLPPPPAPIAASPFAVVLIRRATQQASLSPTTSWPTSTSPAAISTANGTTLLLPGPHQPNRSPNCCTAPKSSSSSCHAMPAQRAGEEAVPLLTRLTACRRHAGNRRPEPS